MGKRTFIFGVQSAEIFNDEMAGVSFVSRDETLDLLMHPDVAKDLVFNLMAALESATRHGVLEQSAEAAVEAGMQMDASSEGLHLSFKLPDSRASVTTALDWETARHFAESILGLYMERDGRSGGLN